MLLLYRTKTDSPLAHILMQFIINENILIKQHKSIIFPIMFTSCTLVNLNKKHKFVYHSHIFSLFNSHFISFVRVENILEIKFQFREKRIAHRNFRNVPNVIYCSLYGRHHFPLNIIPFVLLCLLISIEMILLISLECFVGIMALLFCL